MTEALNDEWENVNRDANGEMVFGTFKNVLLDVTEGMVEMKVVKVGKKKENAWWTEEVKKIVKERRVACKKIRERNVPERMRNALKR